MNGSNLYQQFLALHRPQLESSGVPNHFWETIHFKLTNSIFDAGSSFSLMLIDYGEDDRSDEDPVWTVIVTKQEGIVPNDPNDIYLIDHACTFSKDPTRNIMDNPSLKKRIASIMGMNDEDLELEEKVRKHLWRYSLSYSLNDERLPVEARMPVWYIMDELGSGIMHSDRPNFRIVPFFYYREGIVYSLLFPILECSDGDQVSRDYVEGMADNNQRRLALMLPWKYTDFQSEDFTQFEPDPTYFSEGHIPETLPEPDSCDPIVDPNSPLKVFTQYKVISNYLKDPSFEIVEDEESADILWLTEHFKDFEKLNSENPNKFINQFPCEYVITIKDLLGIVARRANKDKSYDEQTMETYPKWIPTTFNLKTELIKFISFFQNRSIRGFDNHWIIKPFNLARGLDTHITSNLAQIIQLVRTGPKIAQKYLEKPILFHRNEIGDVKFDIRYVVLLKNVQPLEAYVCKNFYLRFANKEFSLNDLHDYEKHFTVMNYAEDTELCHIKCEEFLNMWSEQYPNDPWDIIEQNICNMLKELFINATLKDAPCGIAPSAQSRALYAADIMLVRENNEIQPKLLEINWMPDCKRACEYYTDFFNDIFKLLFLNNFNDDIFRIIAA